MNFYETKTERNQLKRPENVLHLIQFEMKSAETFPNYKK